MTAIPHILARVCGRVRRLGWAAALSAVAASGACSSRSPAEPAIDTEAFVSTYVDLRVAALSGRSREVPPEVRDRILARHGVTEEDLLGFARVHGTDIAFMKRVWDEVQQRLDTARAYADSVGG